LLKYRKNKAHFKLCKSSVNKFIKESLGTSVANCIGKIQSELVKIADEIAQKTLPDNDDDDLTKLIDHLKELYRDKTKNLENIRDCLLLAIYGIKDKDKMKSLLSNRNEIDSIQAQHKKCLQCIESSNIFIIPDGELEHYFKSSTVDYLNITDKDKLFHAERDHILRLDKNDIESKYGNLLTLLKKSIPHINVDMITHIRHTLVEWIQSVQSAISRKEVKDVETLKTNARVNYNLYSQLFECADKGLQVNVNDNTFICTINLKPSLIGRELNVSFDHSTTAHNFKLENPDGPMP